MDIIIAVVLALVSTFLLFTFNRVWLPLWLVKLGEKDTWWSPVRVKPPAGQYAIMKQFTFSKKPGGFRGIIQSVLGHYVDDEFNFVKGDDPKGPHWFNDGIGEKYGLVWVKLFRQYFIEKTEYAALDKPAGGTQYKVVEKKRNAEDDPYYFYQYSTMVAEVRAVEIFGGAQLDMQILFTARHRNPYKVHYLAGKWTARTTATVESGAKDYVRDKKYEEFTAELETEKDHLADYLKNLGDVPGKASASPDNLTAKYGVEIDDPELVSFDLVGGQKIRDAVQEAEVQRNLANAAVEEVRGVKTRAEGERDARKIRAEGIEKEFAARMASDPSGILSLAEALKESKLTGTIVLGQSAVSVPVGNK